MWFRIYDVLKKISEDVLTITSLNHWSHGKLSKIAVWKGDIRGFCKALPIATRDCAPNKAYTLFVPPAIKHDIPQKKTENDDEEDSSEGDSSEGNSSEGDSSK